MNIQDRCAACGVQWKNRKPEIYKTGTKTIPTIFGMQMLSHYGKKRIQLYFCDKHGNQGLKNCTKYMNNTGILKIRNTIKNTWRIATKIGVTI